MIHDAPIDVAAIEQRWQRRIDRERIARKEAERLLEEKSLTLYERNTELRQLADNLEQMVSQRTAELEVALDKSRAATAAKSDFLATMSHEIRTPMNGVLGMTSLLMDTPLNEEQLHYTQVLKSSSQTLLTIINDILDFSKIEAGKLELEHIAYRPHQLITELLDVFKPQAQAKKIELVIQIDPAVPQAVLGDPTRLRQIFFNLISNAIKFTAKGKIIITLATTGLTDQLQASIADSGIGISEEAQQKLFTAFSQADTSITRQYGGTGLGLAICAKLTALMGGSIWVDSVINQGSIFCFTFNAPKSEFQHDVSVRADMVSLAHLNLLLVEDNAVNRLLATKFLEKMGVTPAIACDGVEALEAVRTKRYDIVLMDMQMPNMDGITATKMIRTMSDIFQPTIIALTANAFSEDQQHCLKAGMNDFVSKPINFENLYNTLVRYSFT
jgi:signal transduction histidine kinase